MILSATWLLPIALIPGTWIHTENPSCNDGSDFHSEDAKPLQQQPSQPPPPTPTPPPPPPLPPKDVTSGVSASASGSGGPVKSMETVVKFYRRATIGNIGSNRQK